MRKATAGLLSLALVSGAGVALSAPSAVAAAPKAAGPKASATRAGSDDLSNPLEEKRRALREQALTGVLTGSAKAQKRGASTVVKVGERALPAAAGARSGGVVDQYVELSREKTDKIFVILAEFGNKRDPKYPDQDTDPNVEGPTRFDGPLHNQIPPPDRSQDNTTIWQKNFSQAHFQQLYFGQGKNVESLATWYSKQSSGRYTVNGQVSDWVKVPYNEARYGRSGGYPCPDTVCSNTWDLIRDAVTAWVADQQAKGRTDAQIKADLRSYDQWDRYDFDHDGDFNEPDGYIDHFQIVHAGGDEADGDPNQGEDAIWSHRSYAYQSDEGLTGPSYNKLGGTQLGTTGIWIGDYTIQPENGGVSVFTHEYGHDLGLPDLYDTSGGGENAVNWWSIMAQNRLSAKNDQGLGTRPGDFGAWEKLQLGWLDYEVLKAGQNRTLTLGPSEYNSRKPQAAVVVLPDKTVTTELGKPASGAHMWWSGAGNDLKNSMARQLDLTGASSARASFKTRFDIEQDFDFLYLQASTDGGATWTALDGTVGGKAFPRDASGTPALTGSTAGKWVDATVDLRSVAGKKALFRYYYRTDGGLAKQGFFADDITVTKGTATVVTDGAENGDNGWVLDGFRTTTGTEVNDYPNFYLAANRSYTSFDRYLQTGPYNFGWTTTRPDWVEHFPYQEGLLVSYWDTSVADNNTSEHPGSGLVLPVDAHPRAILRLDGLPWRPRVQGYDATFSQRKADSFTLHVNGVPSYVRGQAAQPVFDDSRSYFDADIPTHGVKVPDTGTRITVQHTDGTSMRIRLSSQ